MTNNVKRVYTRISKDLAVSTDEALVNGKPSNLPLGIGEYTIESVEDLEKNGYPIDDSKSLLGWGGEGQNELGHFEFRLLLPDTKKEDGSYDYPATGVVKIGVVADSIVLDGSGSESVEGLVVSGGIHGANTLKNLAQLAKDGTYLKITAMHLDADDDKHYTSRMVLRSWAHDGTSNKDRNIFYPKSSSGDNQTNIRSIISLDAFLNGFGYLEMPVYRGVGVNVTITTEYQHK
jgi:hypothetical protein